MPKCSNESKLCQEVWYNYGFSLAHKFAESDAGSCFSYEYSPYNIYYYQYAANKDGKCGSAPEGTEPMKREKEIFAILRQGIVDAAAKGYR